MANRFQNRHRDFITKFLVARDGKHCLICGKKPPHIKKLQIDHADNNRFNWDPANLHLLCQKCNLELRYKPVAEHIRIIEHYATNNMNERECKRGPVATPMIKELIDYRSGSIEMKANSYFETQFVEWTMSEITRHGILTKKELINSGATVVGCSQLTASRYLDKLSSSYGPLEETRDTMGAPAIHFRQTHKTKLKTPENQLLITQKQIIKKTEEKPV